MPVDLQTFTADHGALVARLWHCCTAARWGIALVAFGSMRHESVAHRFADSRPSEPAVDAYLASLHLDDLCLTRACADGSGQAWDEFVATHRPRLYAAARAIAGDDGRELADSLYGELYGISGTADGRKSPFRYFHGRSSLTTWLRSILVQRHIDARRAGARTEMVDPSDLEGLPAPHRDPSPDRDRFVRATQAALDEAIGALDEADRLRLRLYYGQQLTLAAIGRATGEHEATVSRKLDRARRVLRKHVEQLLAREHGIDGDALRECFAAAADAPELHLTRLLSRAEDG
jgi:RNA polymerase sigma factor (sigma-70 family)